jgi:hypothetical protein
MDAQTDLRRVIARVMTSAGWVTGTFTLPALRVLQDHLDHAVGYFKLVDVTLPGWHHAVPFFALHRGAVSFVVPSSEDALLVPPPPAGHAAESHAAVCLLPNATLQGQVRVLAHTRLSDHLATHPGFLAFHDCSVLTRGPDGAAEHHWPLVLVAANQMIGVTDAAH